MSQKDSPKEVKRKAEAKFTDVDVIFSIITRYAGSGVMYMKVNYTHDDYMKMHLKAAGKAFVEYGYKIGDRQFLDEIVDTLNEIIDGKHND